MAESTPRPVPVLRPGDPFSPYKRFTGSFIPAPIERSGLSAWAKLVYGRLARYAGENGEAWPKLATLAADLATSPDTIHRAIRELVLRKVIERIRRGRGRSNLYRFLWHGVFDGTATIPPLKPAEIVAINRARQIPLPLAGAIDIGDETADPRSQNADETADLQSHQALKPQDADPLKPQICGDRRESSEENPPEEETPAAAPDSGPGCQIDLTEARPRGHRYSRPDRFVPRGRTPEPEFDPDEQIRLFREMGLETLARQLEADIEAERAPKEKPCP